MVSVGEGCNVQEIEIIGEVVDDENVEGESGTAKVGKGKIVAIIVIDVYLDYCNCNAKVIDANGAVGVCSKCNTKMKLSRCMMEND